MSGRDTVSAAGHAAGFPIRGRAAGGFGGEGLAVGGHGGTRTLYDDMQRMEEVFQRSTLEWTIVRPAGLFNTAATDD